MGSHSRVWWSIVAVVVVLACPMAMLTVSASALLVLAVFSGVVAAALALSGVTADMPVNERVTHATRYGLVGAVVAVSVIGLIASLGGFGLLIAVVFAVSSPPVVGRFYAWRMRTRSEARDAQIPTDEFVSQRPSPSAPVAEMSTTELVIAWRASFNALLRAQTTTSVSHIVARRQAYLDELERRDPNGLRRWLESGARAAGDPTRFLHGDDGGASSEAA